MQTPESRDDEVKDGITLFAKTSEFCFLANAEILGEGTTEVGRDALAEEGEEDDVVRDEHEIEISLSIARVGGIIGRGRSRVRYEEHGRERARRWIINKERGEVGPLEVEGDRDEE